jgi:hypothetical protein
VRGVQVWDNAFAFYSFSKNLLFPQIRFFKLAIGIFTAIKRNLLLIINAKIILFEPIVVEAAICLIGTS